MSDFEKFTSSLLFSVGAAVVNVVVVDDDDDVWSFHGPVHDGK
jgi:hypothetical protein